MNEFLDKFGLASMWVDLFVLAVYMRGLLPEGMKGADAH